jgi:hypothetical protein
VVLEKRNNETRRWKRGFQGRFRRDEQIPTSEDTIRSQVIQANPKILEKTMEKRRRWEAKASTDE